VAVRRSAARAGLNSTPPLADASATKSVLILEFFLGTVARDFEIFFLALKTTENQYFL
jgi:hypothetical protein